MDGIQKIFLDEDGGLRGGWRVAVFLFFYSLIVGVLAVGMRSMLGALGADEATPSYMLWLWSSMLGLVVALIVGWQCGKWLEGLPFAVLGASFRGRWLAHLLVGLIAGAGTVIFAVAIAFAFGGERFESNIYSGSENVVTSTLVSFAVLAIAAAAEEALFRGYILQTLDRAGFAWLAVVLTSVFFGLVHLGNPNAGVISTLNTILAGIWFSVAYLRFRDLWFVTGMHCAWNWVQGSVFGIEVSGMREITEHPLLREIDTGPTWLTGETYGIEGGIAATIAIALSTTLLVFVKRDIAPDSPEASGF